MGKSGDLCSAPFQGGWKGQQGRPQDAFKGVGKGQQAHSQDVFKGVGMGQKGRLQDVFEGDIQRHSASTGLACLQGPGGQDFFKAIIRVKDFLHNQS